MSQLPKLTSLHLSTFSVTKLEIYKFRPFFIASASLSVYKSHWRKYYWESRVNETETVLFDTVA